MSSERKSIWEKIKIFFRNIFKKEKIEALPEPDSELQLDQKQNEEIEVQHETESQESNRSKEEFIELYKKIKDDQVDIKTLTKEDLIMFIKLGNEELKFLDKKIENEKNELKIYKQEIDVYQKETEKTA